MINLWLRSAAFYAAPTIRQRQGVKVPDTRPIPRIIGLCPVHLSPGAYRIRQNIAGPQAKRKPFPPESAYAQPGMYLRGPWEATPVNGLILPASTAALMIREITAESPSSAPNRSCSDESVM